MSNGKPSLILFATPGFCQTAVCGPGVDVLRRLADQFGDKINSVHVEIYTYPFEKLQPVAAMSEWGLRTEPWLQYPAIHALGARLKRQIEEQGAWWDQSWSQWTPPAELLHVPPLIDGWEQVASPGFTRLLS